METVTYRTATLQDIPTLLEFEQHLIAYERPFDINLKDPCTYYDLNYLITSKNAELILGIYNNEIISSGYAKIVDAQPYHKNAKYSYMGFMYVKPEFRGKGVIQTLIKKLKSWSKSKAIFETRLEVYNDNTSAIKAYENNGFKRHMIEMKQYLK